VGYHAFNFHNAKLPEYRGYNAVNHAILNRDEKFTCTVHWMTGEVDRGEIALEATFDIAAEETAISLYAKSHVASLRLFERLVSLLDGPGEIPRRPMEGAGRFYSRKSIEPLREIKDFGGDEAELKARAFFFPPFEPAFLRRGGGKLYVLPACLTASGFELKPRGALEAMIEAVGRAFSCEIR
jgi:methionyl-tRNA formyltransferase